MSTDVLQILDETIRTEERFMPTPMGGTNEHPVRFFERLNDLKQSRQKIAELIEAAAEYSLCPPLHARNWAKQTRLIEKVAACRATPGAHR